MQVARRTPLIVLATALTALALPASAIATAPAERFNAPGQAHADVCADLAVTPAALRFPDGPATGFSVSDDLGFDDDHCPPGSVRLDLHETIPSSRGPLVFHRGGLGYEDRSNVKYGALSTYDLAGALPQPTPSSGGRGAACELADEPPYLAWVRSIPAAMKYKRPDEVPSGSNAGASFLHYGDPGADQGDRTDVHYSYLMWSFVNVDGGGMVRALIAPGEPIRACDVEPVTAPSYDKDGVANGSVTARYVRVMAGNCPLYGWMAWEHEYDGAHVAHALALPAPAAADPPADPACPRAAPAEPPSTVTGAAAKRGQRWALAGTLDPHGTAAGWSFQLGTTRDYGTTTPVERIGASDGATAVATRTEPLERGTTYHYRLVGVTVHGITAGRDRTFTTPGAPPRGPASVVLTGLRVKQARIRFKLTQATHVRFAFERRLKGNWWTPVGGTFRRDAHAGWTKRLRLPARRRPPGRYRLTAFPSGGVERSTSFWLR
ncbi:MAG: hypothetical protein QOG63_546 [Thermoleophilaceae bacterium]|nr:hypothetical protein [Thermoleophilaceae bacterium]